MKVMPIVFFDYVDTVHHEYDPQGQTVNELLNL
jgi:hypothetical protein